MSNKSADKMRHNWVMLSRYEYNFCLQVFCHRLLCFPSLITPFFSIHFLSLQRSDIKNFGDFSPKPLISAAYVVIIEIGSHTEYPVCGCDIEHVWNSMKACWHNVRTCSCR